MGWVSEWVSGWVGGWVGEWVSEWVSEAGRQEGSQPTSLPAYLPACLPASQSVSIYLPQKWKYEEKIDASLPNSKISLRYIKVFVFTSIRYYMIKTYKYIYIYIYIYIIYVCIIYIIKNIYIKKSKTKCVRVNIK